jgi:hypothetical protein
MTYELKLVICVAADVQCEEECGSYVYAVNTREEDTTDTYDERILVQNPTTPILVVLRK